MPAAAKDVIEEKSPYGVNKVLFEEATSIKDQMKLVESRLQKMDEHRAEVSDAVYFKVKTDYETQLDGVRGSFEEKCRDIETELRQLYQAQGQQENELSKHQEVLEEAKFRHMLGEFNDKKFKELEVKQNKEIQNFTEILDVIKGSIKQYENVLGRPFEDKGPPPPERPSKAVVPPPPAEAKPPPPEPKTPAPGKAASGKKGGEEDTQKNSMPAAAPAPEPATNPALPKAAAGGNFDEKLSDELDMFLGTEGDYFNQESEVPLAEPVPADDEPAVLKQGASAKSASKPAEAAGLDDSLSSILKNIPMEMEEMEEPSEVSHTNNTESTGAQIDISSMSEASLLLIEGDLDDPEIVLSENTSIGRSPSNDIVLKESKVSRQHATIHFRNGNYVLVDLKSSNGVFVNGKKVEEAPLKDGDEVAIGSFKFQFNMV